MSPNPPPAAATDGLTSVRRCLRTIRLDPSDGFVFARAAEGGEWAIPGSFLFADVGEEELAAMPAKERAAFRSGFLGATSFGFSTLTVVSEITADEVEALVQQLARGFVQRFGAPDLATARAAAEEEIAFAASLCDHPVNTLVAIHRAVEEGELRERFRTLTPRAENALGSTDLGRFRAFDFFEVEGGETPVEDVDLLALIKDKG